MRFNGLFAAAMAVSLFVSCASENAGDTERAGAALVDSILGADDDTNTPTSFTTSENKPKLNPAHGEPGHRCEIPVGAPLDSDPSEFVEPDLNVSETPIIQQTQPQTQPQPQQVQQPQYDQSLSPAEMLAQGLNPPHGEAGHKCEIPVGAKLNQ